MGSELLDKWMEKHKNNYVAHAIWDDNVDKVLIDGSLEPGELVLRKKHQVSFEKGEIYGSRGIYDISAIVADLKMNKILTSPRLIIENKMSLGDAFAHGFITEEQFNDVRKKRNGHSKITIKLRDGKEYHITYNINGHKGSEDHSFCNIEGIPSVITHFGGLDFDFIPKLEELKKKYKCDAVPILVALDLLSNNPIDKQLGNVWSIYSALCEQKDKREIAEKMITYRDRLMFPSKLNNNIRCEYNGIYWAYGSVVVLRGNPSAIISNTAPELRRNAEVPLLEPFENNGEFFSLNLSDEHTIVIGSKTVLSKHMEQAKLKNVQMIFTEDMNDEQHQWFNVPSQLRSDHARELWIAKQLEVKKAKELEQQKAKELKDKKQQDQKARELEGLKALLKPFNKELHKLMCEILHIQYNFNQTKKTNPDYKDVAESINSLCHTLNEQMHYFFKAPTKTTFARFQNECLSAINEAEKKSKDHRGWHRIDPIIKGILGILAAIAILPALIIANVSNDGYFGTFFATPKTRTYSQVSKFNNGFKKESENVALLLNNNNIGV